MRSRPSAPVPTLVLDNRVRLRDFSAEVEREVRAAFTHANPNHAKLKAIGVFAEKSWQTWRVDDQKTPERNLSVPRGGLRRVLEVLDRLEVKTGVLFDETVNQIGREGLPGIWRDSFPIRSYPSWVDLGAAIAEQWVDESDSRRRHFSPSDSSIKLRDYQEGIVRKLLGIGTMLARSPSGSGKTTAGIACANALKTQTLVLVWSTAVQKEWVKRFQNEIGAHVNTVPQWAKKAPISVLTCQGFTKIAHEHKNVFGLAIFDECFTPESLVLMADGSLRPIEEIRVGDVTAVGGRVLSTFCKWHEGDLFEVGDAQATGNHPIATDAGWVLSSEVRNDDLMLYDPTHEERKALWYLRQEHASRFQESIVRSAYRRAVHQERLLAVRQTGDSQAQGRSCLEQVRHDRPVECRANIGDRPASRESIQGNEAARTVPGSQGCMARPKEEGQIPQGEVGGTDEEVLSTRGAREESGESVKIDCRREGHSVRREDARQRDASDRRRDRRLSDLATFRVSIPGDRVGQAEDRRDAQSLQDRCRTRREEDRSRDRRFQSSDTRTKEGGRAQDILPRVEGLEGSPLPGASRLRADQARVRRVAVFYSGRVHNIETETNVYVAGGALVHNCQRASAKSFYRCVDELAATYKLGISADERRSDGKECIIRDLFGDVEVDVDRQQMVEEGNVLDVEIRIVPWSAPAPTSVTRSREAFRAVKEGTASGEDRALASKVTENHHAILDFVVADQNRGMEFARIVEDELKTGAKVLVLTERREQAVWMMRGLSGHDPVSLVGGDVAKGLELLNKPRFRLAIGTYKAVGVGMNLPDFDVGVYVDPCHHDERNLRQFVSRLNRPAPGKKPRCYVPCDVGCYGLAPARAYARWFERVYVRAKNTNLFDELVPVKEWIRAQ